MKYDPKAASPDRWLTFLHELLDDADIPTLQEYLGYCLIPSTKGQKMMLIVGKGGEGKSRIGPVSYTHLDFADLTAAQIADIQERARKILAE